MASKVNPPSSIVPPSTGELFRICSAFRKAGEELRYAGEPVLEHFPTWCCGVMSRALGGYLCHRYPGLTFHYICGYIGEQTHAWVAYNGLYIDLTADQFSCCDEPIIIRRKEDSVFHRQFRIRDIMSRRLDVIDLNNSPEYEIYSTAVRFLGADDQPG